MENPPSKVLIFDTAWLGDVIFTTSLIGSVKKVWPTVKLHVLVAKRGELLIRNHPLVDKVWIYDKNGSENSLGDLFRLASKLKAETFDIVLNAHPSFRSRLITRLTGAPIRAGYYGFGSGLAFTHRIENSLEVKPDHAQRRVDLLRVLVHEATIEPLQVGVTPETKQLAFALVRKLAGAEKPLLGLIPGSARLTKMWPRDHFSAIAKRWIRDKNGIALVFGGKHETSLVKLICDSVGENCHPIVNLPLDEVAGLLAQCSCTVGNDTGVSFLAIAAGCAKVLVLYGCTQVNYSFPLPHKAIAAGVPCCLPPTGHGRASCKWGETPWCMQQISVERVWSELEADS
ncbi:glycosyltransferase family 9 protein [bacterium]|nr:glycosyltransferase family 9 protein [bacterium]MBU1638296.1 glycosyltransferase family 9 protein [bacterium]